LEHRASGILADEEAIREFHVFPFPVTPMTCFTRWEEAIRKEQHCAIPPAFVLDLLAKFPHTDITDGASKLTVSLHPFHVQIFENKQLGAQWGIDLSRLVEQLLHLFLASLLLGLGFREGQQRGKMCFEADAFAWGKRRVNERTGGLMEDIFSDIGNASMQTSNLIAGFLAIL